MQLGAHYAYNRGTASEASEMQSCSGPWSKSAPPQGSVSPLPPPLPHPPHPSQPTGRAAAADPTLRKPSLSSSTPSPYPPWHALSALTPAGPSSIKSHRDPRTVCFRIASSVLLCSLPPSESTSTSQQPCYLRPAGGTSTCSTTPFHFLIYSF